MDPAGPRASSLSAVANFNGTTRATVGKVLAWMTDNQGTNEDGAKYFLKTYPDMWTKWVAPDVAAKVKASI